MGIRDAVLILSDEQAETTVAAHDSENVIDLGASHEYGAIQEAMVMARVNTAFASGGSATLTVALQDSADNSSFAAVDPAVTTGAVAVADLTAGKFLLRTKLPRGLRRYVKLVYTIGTAAMTAGTIDAWISPFGDPDVE